MLVDGGGGGGRQQRKRMVGKKEMEKGRTPDVGVGGEKRARTRTGGLSIS
eukprot:gene7103-3336_t